MPGTPALPISSPPAPPTHRRWISRRDWQDIRRATQRLQVDGVYAVTVHGVRVEFVKHHSKQAKAEPIGAAVADGAAKASKPRRRRAGQLKRDAVRASHREVAQQQQQRQEDQPQQQLQQEQRKQQRAPPQPTQQRQQQQQQPLLPPQSDHMDDERAPKRSALSPAQGSAPRAKRLLTLAPPHPSLPPSPPSTPPRQAHREGAPRGSQRTAHGAGLQQALPLDPEPARPSLRCTMCLRDLPWLYNETDALCRTCDAFDKRMRRTTYTRRETAPSPSPGGRVRLHSLARADLNGKLGTLGDFCREKERWAVMVDGQGILLREENLECVVSESESDSD